MILVLIAQASIRDRFGSGTIPGPHGEAVVPVTDLDEFRVLHQFELPHHIKDLDPAVNRTAEKELVPLRRELHPLTGSGGNQGQPWTSD